MTPEDRFKQLGSAKASSPSEAEWQEFRAAAHRSLTRRRIAAAVGGVGLVVALVAGTVAVTNLDTGDRRGPGVVGTPTAAPTDDTDDPTPGPSETEQGPTDPVDREVPMPLNQWYVETDGKLTPFIYFMNQPVTPRKLLEQTIDFIPGPLGETGVTSAVPENARLEDLSFEDDTAYVALSGEGPGKEADRRMAHAQIVYTATQFPGIEKASITWSNDQGRLESREDFHDLLPVIAVEEPYAVQEVYRTFKLKGIANVFEANVSWRLTDEDGEVFKEGFVTATCGSGCWGTFEDRITLERVPGKRIVLEVFQSSAEDGSPMNMVRIPLEVQLD